MRLTWFKSAAASLPRMAAIGCGMLVIAAVSAPAAFAAFGPPSAPEIDPGSAASALALLAGGVLLLKSRIRR